MTSDLRRPARVRLVVEANILISELLRAHGRRLLTHLGCGLPTLDD